MWSRDALEALAREQRNVERERAQEDRQAARALEREHREYAWLQDARFRDERKSADEWLRDAYKSLDQAILTVASGLLVFTVTFTSQLLPSVREPWPLILAWWCWAGSICFVVWSFVTSQWALLKSSENVDRAQRGLDTSDSNPADRATSVLNLVSPILFTAGVLMFLVFGGCNADRIAVRPAAVTTPIVIVVTVVSLERSANDASSATPLPVPVVRPP